MHGRALNLSEAAERARIMQVLKETKGMVGETNGAAVWLGLKRTTLQSRMRRYDISRLFQ
jgi:transcriptional regulator with GAF, ATPase, and Fis domain